MTEFGPRRGGLKCSLRKGQNRWKSKSIASFSVIHVARKRAFEELHDLFFGLDFNIRAGLVRKGG